MNRASPNPPRRDFLKSAGLAGAAFSFGDLGFLRSLPQVNLKETRLQADDVRFTPEIEPLVRLLEETPRAKVVSVFADQIRNGKSYREVLAALLLAGVRNVQPRPSVGFKFHAVLVVNSAHLASLAARDRDRWLPIFWALDYFKSAQSRDQREGNWTMAAIDDSKVAAPTRAKAAFVTAMDQWDVAAADRAVAGLCRTAISQTELFDLFSHYGCRDYRSIGHKAIYVANSFRTLQCIGWQYAEPVLRSLAYALLNHQGSPNPADSDLKPDAAWRVTQSKLRDLPANWQPGRLDRKATLTLLQTMRSANPQEAVEVTADMIASGIASRSISDALFLASAEMLSQQPGIISLHSSTTTNALQYSFRTTWRPETRYELMLQNAAFIPYFRESMKSRGQVNDARIDKMRLQPEGVRDPSEKRPGKQDVDLIFAQVSKDRDKAATAINDYLRSGGQPEVLMDAARRLVFAKGDDAHDYKFSSAVLEDYYAISRPFRDAYLANAAYLLRGSGDRDNGLVDRVHDALT